MDLQMLSDRGELWPNDKVGIVVDAMGKRCRPQENIRVGRQGGARVGKSAGEKHAAPGKTVDIGCGEMFFGITAQPVGPERIDGDEEEVLCRLILADRAYKITGKKYEYCNATREKKTKS